MTPFHAACLGLAGGAVLLVVSVVLGLRDGEHRHCAFPNITDDDQRSTNP